MKLGYYSQLIYGICIFNVIIWSFCTKIWRGERHGAHIVSFVFSRLCVKSHFVKNFNSFCDNVEIW